MSSRPTEDPKLQIGASVQVRLANGIIADCTVVKPATSNRYYLLNMPGYDKPVLVPWDMFVLPIN